MASEQALRIGIIGAGSISVEAIGKPAGQVDDVILAGVAARDPARARAFAERWGVEVAYDTYEDLYAAPAIDVVYLGTPPGFHVEQALAAIAHGKSVLVEKPFALNSTDAARVLDAARQKGVRVFEAMHSPHHRMFGRILEILSSGRVGTIRETSAEFGVPISDDDSFRWNAQLGGGALMDLGVYPLAWTRRVAGEAFEILAASAVFDRGVDASFEAELLFGDVLAKVQASMTVPTPRASLKVVGDRGTLTAVNPLVPQLLNSITVEDQDGTHVETVGGPTTYEAQLGAVRDTLKRGAEFPFAPGDFVCSMVAIERIRDAMTATSI